MANRYSHIGRLAISLSNGVLLRAGTDEAYNEVTNVLEEWPELGEPNLSELTPCFIHEENGWAVRPHRLASCGGVAAG